METYRAGCGMEIREEDGFVCPYFSRPDEWKKKNCGFGPCEVDLQTESNVCLYAPDEFFN